MGPNDHPELASVSWVSLRGKSDAAGAVSSVERIVTGLKWRAVQAPITFVGAWDDAFIAACEELGMAIAAGLELGIYGR